MVDKVRLPQADGDVVLTYSGDPETQRRFVVKDHVATPATLAEQASLLLIDGAELATVKRDVAGTPGTSNPR